MAQTNYLAGRTMSRRTTPCEDSGQNITHQKSQKGNSIGKYHWTSIGHSSKNPLDKWQSFGQNHRQVKFRWKMPLKIHWKMPLKIHDGFWGVGVWCAIFCPYRLRSQKSRVRGSNPGSTACLGLRMPLPVRTDVVWARFPREVRLSDRPGYYTILYCAIL